MKLATSSDLEIWAITSVRGLTKEERELAASCLFAAAKAYAQHAADIEIELRAQLESAQRENGILRELRRKVAALTLESIADGGVLILSTSGPAPVQTPGHLRVVPKEGGR